MSILSVLLPWVLLVSLAVHFGAHVAIIVGLVKERAFVRAAVAFFVSPLAVYWAWKAGMRRRVYVWSTALALYALSVALA